MNIILHRGTEEVVGPCVEFRTEKSRILIDFGMPLVNDKKEPFDSKVLKGKSLAELKKLKILPEISGLYKDEEKDIDAVLISHSHLDHYGFLRYVHPDIPVYMSKGAGQLIKISNIFISHKTGSVNSKTIDKGKKVKIGQFIVTPYLVDHSAFDARAFLVEAEGRRVFYSGDFRGHCRKSVLFKDMINNPPENIDCLLMEESMLGRGPQLYENEDAVQDKITKILRNSSNITFLFSASQNIDRLVSAYKACLSTDSIFVIDIYTAFVLDNLRKVSARIPQFDWRNIRIKFLKHHADVLAVDGYSNLLFIYNKSKIDMFELNRKKNKILLLERDNSIFPKILKDIDNPEGATIIYSMWEGYLTDEFKNYCESKSLKIEEVHTSRHVTVEDLKAFAKAISPKTLIPIYTFEEKQYPEILENVRILKDGELFDV